MHGKVEGKAVFFANLMMPVLKQHILNGLFIIVNELSTIVGVGGGALHLHLPYAQAF